MDDDHGPLCVRDECVHQRVEVFSRDAPPGGIRHRCIAQPVTGGICPRVVVPEVSGNPRPSEDIRAGCGGHIPSGVCAPVLCMNNRMVEEPVVIDECIPTVVCNTNTLPGGKVIAYCAAGHYQAGIV